LKRVSWVLVLVVAAGCKKSEEPIAAELVRTSPGVLLASPAPPGNALEVAGLVKDLQDTKGALSVRLDSGDPERAVVCRADATRSAAVGQLVPGQLVAVQGLSRGLAGGGPLIDPCRVTWAGPSPRTDPPGGREALRAARSLEVCMLPLLVDERRRQGEQQPDGRALTGKSFRAADVARGERLDAAEKAARAQLAAEGLSALGCDHPLIHLLKRCEGGSERERAGAECTSRHVSEILDLLPH